MVLATELNAPKNNKLSEVQPFYDGAHILITGGTGFVGHLLIQKLVTDCPGISKIYLLIRPKKNKTPEERLKTLFENSVFHKMIKVPNYLDKFQIVTGDMTSSYLGLNEEDKQLLCDKVNIVFHVAATINFTEKIKRAVLINVRSTMDLLKLAKNMPLLKSFVYCSTSYSHCVRKDIGEEIYDMPWSLEKVLHITDLLTDDELSALTPKLLGEWPNTYSFTKGLAENAVKELGNDLPICVFRPSMITSTFAEPLEGWVNNFNGPSAFGSTVCVGITHVINTEGNCVSDFMPADYVVNNMIVLAKYIGNKSKIYSKDGLLNTIPVFNCVSSNHSPVTWGGSTNNIIKNNERWVSVRLIWYPFVIFCPNKQKIIEFLRIIFHNIPAYFIDLYLTLINKKPRMQKLYTHLHMFMDSVSYFAVRQWNFKQDNNDALWDTLNDTDKKLFHFSMKGFSWPDFFDVYSKGYRLHMFKDPLDTIPKAKARYQKIKYVHFTVLTAFCLLMAYLVFRFMFI